MTLNPNPGKIIFLGWVGGGREEGDAGAGDVAKLSYGHVDIDRMIIPDDNPNQGFFIGGRMGVRVKWGQGRSTRQGEEQ